MDTQAAEYCKGFEYRYITVGKWMPTALEKKITKTNSTFLISVA
jgi:hypothetical protein